MSNSYKEIYKYINYIELVKIVHFVPIILKRDVLITYYLQSYIYFAI